MTLYRPLEAAPGALRFKLFHLGAPDHAVRQPADARAHGPARCSTSGRTASRREGSRRSGCTTSACSRAVADADVEIDALHEVFEDAFGRIFRGEVENDDFNRLVVAARLPADEIVVLRAYAKYLRQIGFPLSQAFIEATLAAHAGHRAHAGRAVQGALRSRRRRRRGRARRRAGARDRGGARAGRQPVRGPRAAPVPGADPGDDAHELLAPRRAGQPRTLPVVQVRSVEGAGPARAQADVRDLRLLAALRGRAPARRQGRARRAALVGPARGFPHRGAGPREGADGEEHGDRAGRLEGRLRAEARAAPRPIARRS